MKNPVVQTALSALVAAIIASVLLLIVGPAYKYADQSQYKVFIGLIFVVSLGAYFGVQWLLSRTPEEIDAEVTKLEMAEYFKKIDQALESITTSKQTRSLTSTVRSAINAIQESCQNTINDLKLKPDETRIFEFSTDLGDFAEALVGYVGALTGDISFDTDVEKEDELKAFEDTLPKFVQGFKSYETEVDGPKKLLAAAKRNLAENRMRSRGRIN